MKNELKILMWEDNDRDADQIKAQLCKGGFRVQVHRLADRNEFLEVAAQELPDLILSEHQPPEKNGFVLRAMAGERHPTIPFVFVTGLHGTEKDIETMDLAGMPYVLKHRLSGLVPVVRRALRKADQSGEGLMQSTGHHHEFTRHLLDGISDFAICQLDGGGRLTSWNAGAQGMLGFAEEEILGWNFSGLFLPDGATDDWPSRMLAQAAAERKFHEEIIGVRKDGTTFWAEVVIAPLPAIPETPPGFVLVVQDITERKEKERERERMTLELQSTLNEVKILSGSMPICASCKKVRDYKGQWHPLEDYLREHSEATLTHEFCDDCFRLIQVQQTRALSIPAVAGKV